jgi:glucose/arabinose dehydrogenase
MNKKPALCLVGLALLLSVLLAACQSQEPAAPASTIQDQPTQTTGPAPSATPAATTQVPAEPPTATNVPTETPVPETPTPSLSEEAAVSSINELVGIWRGYWSDQNNVYLEMNGNGYAKVYLLENRYNPDQIVAYLKTTLDKGSLTIVTTGGSNVSEACEQNPSANY